MHCLRQDFSMLNPSLSIGTFFAQDEGKRLSLGEMLCRMQEVADDCYCSDIWRFAPFYRWMY